MRASVVRVIVRLGAAAATALLASACGTGSIVAPAHAIRPVMPDVFITAKLVLENGCPLLDDANGTLLPIWPEGVNLQGSTLRMREAPVGDVGEVVRLGGHWLVPDEVGEVLLAPLPVACSGSGRVFWVQTFELLPPEAASEAERAV
jgi:hypothetical protein